MPCYSYNDGNPVFYADNIEKVYSASGATYSYSDIYWICEFPVTSQLKVYTRASAGAEETQLIENTHYTFDVTNNNIVFVSAPATGQVVIRRSTPSDRMLFRFTDGAKLTAEQLNTSFHQLLFTIQEKEFASDKISYFSTGGLTVEGGISPLVFDLDSIGIGQTLVWDGSKFVPGEAGTGTGGSTFLPVLTTPIEEGSLLVVSGVPLQWRNSVPTVNIFQDNLIFKDRVFYKNRTIGNDTSYTSDGSSINVSTKSFLTRFKTTSPNLQWVLLDAPTGYHLIKTLIPSGGVFKEPEEWFNWVQETLDDIIIDSGNPTKMKFYWNLGLGREPYTAKSNATFTNGNPNDAGYENSRNRPLNSTDTQFWDHPREFYSPFGYVHSRFFGDPTVLNPREEEEGILLSSITTDKNLTIIDINFFSYNNTWSHRYDNPWVYGEAKTRTGLTPFFNDPDEFEGFNSILNHKSKVYGYGVKAFYLSIPQCTTSTLKLPVFTATNTYFHMDTSVDGGVSETTVKNEINQLGYEWESEDPQTQLATGTKRSYCDYYLLGLRDLAFAAARPLYQYAENQDLSEPKYRDNLARYFKGGIIKADYSGWNTLSSGVFWTNGFKRLEISSETIRPITFKIPEQIIYFNEAALALGISPTRTTIDDVKQDVRFQGLSRYFIPAYDDVSSDQWNDTRLHRFTSQGLDKSPAPSGTFYGGGYYFKADGFWKDWSSVWSTDTTSPTNIRQYFFNMSNEACVDWFITETNLNTSGVVNAPTNNAYYNSFNKMPTMSTINATAGQLGNIKGKYFVPWMYRPNELHATTPTPPAVGYITNGYQGNHLINIDGNCLFSQASGFIPDPVDEYVFRIVSKNTIASLVRDPNKDVLNSSVILEWGLTNQPGSGTTETLTDIADIFADTSDIESLRASSRYDYSKLKVYIKNEKVEMHDTTPRYVITLAVQTPRIKSIGYSKVFRRFTSQDLTLNYPQWDSNSDDTEKDGGPWNFSLIDFRNTTTSTGTALYNESAFNVNTVSFGDGTMDSVEGNLGTTRISSIAPTISGRNECAVKFTRAGIPGNLWIRLSVLTSDACEPLLVGLDPDNLNFSEFTGE
jgi:hypothetical protein